MRGKSIWTVDCKEPISRYGASGRSVTSEIILWVVVLLTFYRSRSLKKMMSLYLGKGLKTAMYLVYSDRDKLFVFNHDTVAKPVLSRISFKGLSRYEVSVLSTLE